jgi:hypothetical protein
MSRDNGWIETLLEDAYNERMHLLTFLKMAEPGVSIPEGSHPIHSYCFQVTSPAAAASETMPYSISTNLNHDYSQGSDDPFYLA